ncbi:MAG: SLBB domain-containing protein, partial [Candidatus Eremiobacteraeota bacterium]|nr:SLBB domain-containing protein [Candidatus Eremiobacteraeota bacterium]
AVDVTLEQEGQTVFIIGGPGGTIAYNPGETLASALQQLSLKNPNFQQSAADLHHVRILRDGDNVGPVDALALTASGSAGPALHPGDTISLPNKPIAIAVRGEVKQPGMAYLSSDETIADALTQVGGLTTSASSSNFI